MIDNLRKYSALTLCSALLLGVPPVISGGEFLSFDQAQAAKGGNGNGKGEGGGKSSNAGGQSTGKSSNAGGQSADKSSKSGGQSAGKTSKSSGQSASKSSNAGGKASATKTASVDKKAGAATIKRKKAAGSQKASTTSKGPVSASKKEVAATEDTAPNKNSALGRWNAVKPLEHPAVQAHIKNGNFNGTIGLNAAYVLAQTEYDNLEKEDLTAAQALVNAAKTYEDAQKVAEAVINEATDAYNEANGTTLTPVEFLKATLESAVADYNTKNKTNLTVEEYKAGLLDRTIEPSNDVEQALVTQAQPEPEGDVGVAQDLLDDATLALDALAAAEKAMADASNRGEWADIREDVRAKMNLEPDDNDVQEAADAAAAEAAAAEAAAAEAAAAEAAAAEAAAAAAAASEAAAAVETPEVTETPEPTQPAGTTTTSEEIPPLEETASAQ